MSSYLTRLLPYLVAFIVGAISFYLLSNTFFAVTIGIATWLCCAGYVPNPIVYLERLEREKCGIPELKFAVGDRVSIRNKGEIQFGTVTRVSPGREMFVITWDYGDNSRWHPV